MILFLHEMNENVGFLPRTTEYITLIVEKGSSFFRDCWVFQIGPSQVFGEGVGAIFRGGLDRGAVELRAHHFGFHRQIGGGGRSVRNGTPP